MVRLEVGLLIGIGLPIEYYKGYAFNFNAMPQFQEPHCTSGFMKAYTEIHRKQGDAWSQQYVQHPMQQLASRYDCIGDSGEMEVRGAGRLSQE